MRDEQKPLLKGSLKIHVCPNVLFDCYTKPNVVMGSGTAAVLQATIRSPLSAASMPDKTSRTRIPSLLAILAASIVPINSLFKLSS